MFPQVPPSLPDTSTGLRVEAWYDLTPQEFEPLRPLLGQESQRHVRLHRTVEADGRSFSLDGLTGIHDYHGDPAFEEAAADDPTLSGLDLHYWFRLQRRGDVREDSTDAGWDEVVAAVRRVIGTHSAKVVLYERHQAATVVPAVALPIVVKEADVPGFSEIRGVRLVRGGPDAGARELYSVTIDRIGDRYSSKIEASVDIELGEGILVVAHERARSIADLAFHRVT